jgi:hypothetical protein
MLLPETVRPETGPTHTPAWPKSAISESWIVRPVIGVLEKTPFSALRYAVD